MINRISKPNITNKNLNLLAILAAVIETESVTEAAKKLRMSQPNLSRALRLLREEFDDPLFVRTSRGFAATKRAQELYIPLQEMMRNLEKVYSKTEFDIRTAKGSFTVATTDYIEFLLAPALTKIMEEEAPGISLNFRPSQGNLQKGALEKGEYDLTVLVVREEIPQSFIKQELFLDPYVCAVRKNHPLLTSKLTIPKFTQYNHVLINPQGALWTTTDDNLQKLKMKRHLTLRTPNALSAIAAISKSDLVLTATRRFVEATQEFFPIEIFKGPFEIEPIRIAQIWHERSHSDPLHTWIRQKIKSVL